MNESTSRSRRPLRLLTGLCLVGLPNVAWASEGGGGIDALLFQGLNLALVLGLIFYYARRPVADFFGSRRDQIKNDLDTAAQLLSDAESRNSALQRKLVDLQSEIEEIRESTRRRAEDESERIIAEARKTAERIHADSIAAIAQESARAKRELREEAASLALELAGEILREKVGSNDRDRLLDEFITRVETANR